MQINRDDIDRHLRFIDYLRGSLPGGDLEVKKIKTGYRVVFDPKEGKRYEAEFGPTVVSHKDARRRCLEKILRGIRGEEDEYVKFGCSSNGYLQIVLSPKISKQTGLTEGSRFDLFIGNGGDEGRVRMVASPNGAYQIRKGRRASIRLSSIVGLDSLTPTKLRTTSFVKSPDQVTLDLNHQ